MYLVTYKLHQIVSASNIRGVDIGREWTYKFPRQINGQRFSSEDENSTVR